MRALTVEELDFVSGGFLEEFGDENEVVVTGQRRKPWTGISAAVWGQIAADEVKFGAFCNSMSGSFKDAMDRAAVSSNNSDTGAMVGGGGILATTVGAAICGFSFGGGLTAFAGCPLGGTIAAGGGTAVVLGGGTALGANIKESQHREVAMAIRQMAVMTAGCPASNF
jgi:hypothetical protein